MVYDALCFLARRAKCEVLALITLIITLLELSVILPLRRQLSPWHDWASEGHSFIKPFSMFVIIYAPVLQFWVQEVHDILL